MLNTLFSGTAPLIGNAAIIGIPGDALVAAQAYNSVSVVQIGFFVPTVSANHAFKINTSNGCYLAVDGQVLLNTNNFSGWANSANVNLVAGKSYSFVYSVPFGPAKVTSIVLSIAGGGDIPIQNNQVYTATDLFTNPLYNANAVLQSIIGSQTPSYVKPLANLIATNITANTTIASVPCPAVIPSISSSVLGMMNNTFYCPIPVPSPVTCYNDVIVTPPIVDTTRPNPTSVNNTTPGSSGAGNARYRYRGMAGTKMMNAF